MLAGAKFKITLRGSATAQEEIVTTNANGAQSLQSTDEVLRRVNSLLKLKL